MSETSALLDAQAEIKALRARVKTLEKELVEARKSQQDLLDEKTVDTEIMTRLHKLKTLIQSGATSAAAPASSSTGPSAAAIAPVKASAAMTSKPSSRVEQIKTSERSRVANKFSMLKYSSVGTAYGEEPESFVETEIPDTKMLDFDSLDFEDEIGCGAFSVVYSGTWKEKEVAIKKLSFDALEVEEFLIMFKKEVALLSILEHPNIVEFIGVVTWPSYYMVTAFMHEGALDDILHDPETEMSWSRRVSLLQDVAKGMNYLHTRIPRVIHRDLKCANVLVDKDWRAAITDFGLSVAKTGRMDPVDLKAAYNIRMSLESSITGRHQSYVKPLQGPVGTFPYIAPELIESKPYNEMVDIFSYAMVLFHVVTRTPPWAGLTDSVFQAKELTENYRPPIAAWVPEPYARLIEQCWNADAYKRPTFESILKTLETEIAPLPSPNFPKESE